jgi:hypothetical protein
MMLNRSLPMTSLAALLLLSGSSVTSLAAEPSAIPNLTTDPDASEMMPRETVPSCVWIRDQGPHHVTLKNDCDTQQRVKVIVAWGQDTECKAINPHSEKSYDWGLGRFDGLTSC